METGYGLAQSYFTFVGTNSIHLWGLSDCEGWLESLLISTISLKASLSTAWLVTILCNLLLVVTEWIY